MSSTLFAAPFHARVERAAIDDLRARLAATRWPAESARGGWTYGANIRYLRELVAYWRDGFDWNAFEARLNRFPSFRATVGGMGIHFVHVRGRGPNPFPLVVTHGWPSSYLEMHELVEMLTDPERFGGCAEDSFDVVVPSLPGYGFSETDLSGEPVRPRIPDLWCELMRGLGYERFGAHGGDIGASVTTQLGRRHPQHVAGIHVTAIIVPTLTPASPPLNNEERAYAALRDAWEAEEGAYSHMQRTRPQTAAYGLNDSPVGLAAWIIEKWRAWSDCHGEIESRFSKDFLLSMLSLYWLTQTIGSSFRLYHDSRYHPTPLEPGEMITVPTGVGLTTEPVDRAPKAWASRSFSDIRRWTEHDRGGHFFAAEEPALLAHELREFFRPLRKV